MEETKDLFKTFIAKFNLHLINIAINLAEEFSKENYLIENIKFLNFENEDVRRSFSFVKRLINCMIGCFIVDSPEQ